MHANLEILTAHYVVIIITCGLLNLIQRYCDAYNWHKEENGRELEQKDLHDNLEVFIAHYVTIITSCGILNRVQCYCSALIYNAHGSHQEENGRELEQKDLHDNLEVFIAHYVTINIHSRFEKFSEYTRKKCFTSVQLFLFFNIVSL